MNRVRQHLSYANLVSSLCLVAVLGSGTAYAATHLGKHSVGTKQLKNHAVTASKLAASLSSVKHVYDSGLIRLSNGHKKVVAKRGPLKFTAKCIDAGTGQSTAAVTVTNTGSTNAVLESDVNSEYASPQLAPGASRDGFYRTTNSTPYFFGEYFNMFAAAAGKTSVNGFGSIGTKVLGSDCVYQVILIG